MSKNNADPLNALNFDEVEKSIVTNFSFRRLTDEDFASILGVRTTTTLQKVLDNINFDEVGLTKNVFKIGY